MFYYRLANMLFDFVVPGSSFVVSRCSEHERSICSYNYECNVSAVEFHTGLVRFEVEETVGVFAEVVNKNVVVQRLNLT